jgi:small subunit ribosomal protein S1
MRQTEQSSFIGKGAQSSSVVGVSSMEEWLKSNTDVVAVQRGDILEGTIVSASPTEILIDVGCKADGVVSGRELERITPEELAELHPGDSVAVFVILPEDRDGNIILSLSRAHSLRDWRRAEELFESQEVFDGYISDCNKGGVIVNVGRLRGFVPASQLTPELHERVVVSGPQEDGAQWRYLIGHDLKVKVIEVDRNRNRLILSERAATRDWRQSAKQKLLSQLQVGETRAGVVTSLCDFGAFVDLGGADGLVHLSEISWERVTHPREVLQEGQRVEVYVLEVDQEKQRIGLSLRRLMSQPWEDIAARFVVGQVVEGTITKVVNFGAFARIGDNVEGLIHISELADARINHPHEVVHEGDAVPLKIIRIDAERRRIGLSLKQAREDVVLDWREELASRPQEGETVETV